MRAPLCWLLVALGAICSCALEEGGESPDVHPVYRALAEKTREHLPLDKVKDAIQAKTDKVLTAQKQREEARKALKQAGLPIPAVLKEGTLVTMLESDDHEKVVQKIEEEEEKMIKGNITIPETEPDPEGSPEERAQARFERKVLEAQSSRAHARQKLKEKGKPIPTILTKGALVDQILASKNTHEAAAVADEIRKAASEEPDDLKVAASDTLSLLTNKVIKATDPVAPDADKVTRAKELRLKARIHLTKEGKKIPYVLQKGTLSKLMAMKEKHLVRQHIEALKTKSQNKDEALQNEKKIAKVRKQRAIARRELIKQKKPIPYFLAKGSLDVIQHHLTVDEKKQVLAELKKLADDMAAHDRSTERAASEDDEELKELRAARKKARDEYRLNKKPIPYVLIKGSLDVILNHLNKQELVTVQAKLRQVMREVDADENHKPLQKASDGSAPSTRVGEEMMDQAAEKALIAEDHMLAQKTGDEPDDDEEKEDAERSHDNESNAARSAIMAGLRSSKEAVAMPIRDNSTHFKSAFVNADGTRNYTHNRHGGVKGCVSKPVDLAKWKSLVDQLEGIQQKASALRGLEDDAFKQAQDLRGVARQFLADSCTPIPHFFRTRAEYAGVGLDEVAAYMKKELDEAMVDAVLRKRKDTKGRLVLLIKKATEECADSDANAKLNDADTVATCVKRVMGKVKAFIDSDAY